MKKYLYHYTCLMLSIFQLVVFIASIKSVLKYQTAVEVILCFIIMYLIAIADWYLRGINKHNLFLDCLILTLISPLRCVCELSTIIRLHIASANGNDNFAERKCSNDFYYFLFNANSKDSKLVSSLKETIKPFSKKKKKPSKEEGMKIINDYFAKQDSELNSAEIFLHNNKRNDGKYNVYLVPLCCLDNDEFLPFFVQNANYNRGQCHIYELYINGHKIIHDVDFEHTLVFSLEPGKKYNFEVHVRINATPDTVSIEKNKQFTRKFKLNDVYIGNDNVYLGLFIIFSTVRTVYTEKLTGKFVNDKFEKFDEKERFGQVSLEFLKELSDSCMINNQHISEVHTQYKYQKDIASRRK